MSRTGRGGRIAGPGAALVASVLLTVLPAGPGRAAPPPPGPTPAGHPAPRAAVAAARERVLIVHVSGGAAGVRAAIDRTKPGTLRHAAVAAGSFSIQVPAARAAATARRLGATPGVTSVEATPARTFFAATDDPGLPRQLPYLDDVRAPAAWQRQHATTDVRIAILDSGVDIGHPDLRDEIVGRYNAHTGGTDVTDLVGHGTFVAGVAAAGTDNGIGVAGAGYGAGILAVKIADQDGDIAIDDEVRGIRWAVAHGADIINLSLGGPTRSASEAAAIAAAQRAGVLVVAAAGNAGSDTREYPASYPGVVAVGATDGAGARAGFSSYGSWVDLAAPGVGIYSTTPRAGSDYFPATSGYGSGDGTSFSAPLVAGEAALLEAADPTITPAGLRHALVASAHGYQHLGLGAGQADFARALEHLPPSAAPATLVADAGPSTVTFTAGTPAPQVEFRIDGGPPLPAVRTTGGTARLVWASAGYRDGAHTVRAVACSAYGECGSAGRSVGFTLATAPPGITSPTAGVTVSGRFTVHAAPPAGGALRLLVDGRVVPAERVRDGFRLSASGLADGRHTLTVQDCSRDLVRCAGPVSGGVPVTALALHPVIDAVAPAAISPNHDGRQDTSRLRFGLDHAARVAIEISDRAGSVLRTVPLGRLGRGAHTWTWDGRGAAGRRLPDGRYTVAVTSSRTVAGRTRAGWVARTVVVDTVAPRVSGTAQSVTRFYPHPDGYRDSDTMRTTLSAAATLTLTVRDASGGLVRRSSRARPAGAASITWKGANDAGHRVAAGRYRWQFTVTDEAGNTDRSMHFTVSTSSRRLVTRTVHATARGDRYVDAGGTSGCATAERTGSAFAHGVRLVNRCATGSADVAFAHFAFTVPAAESYRRIVIQAYGRSVQHPSQVIAAIGDAAGNLEVPSHIKVGSARTAWYTIARVPARAHVTAHRGVYIGVVLGSAYPGANDFDIGAARVAITERVLE